MSIWKGEAAGPGARIVGAANVQASGIRARRRATAEECARFDKSRTPESETL